MKILKTLFEKENYDSKNILNRSNRRLPIHILDRIEKEGVTIEDLEDISEKQYIPIFKYRTQLTIHGLFPDIGDIRIGGYKLIFQNKNLSIGVKWNAVDFEKKKRIFYYLKQYGWYVKYNSSELYAYVGSDYFTSKDTGEKELELITKKIKHINTKLFFGNVYIHLVEYMGFHQIVAILYINSIYEKNVNRLIENILQKSIPEMEKEIEDKRIESENKRKQEQQERIQEEERLRILRQPILESIYSEFEEIGFRKMEKMPVSNGLIRIKIWWKEETDYSYDIEYFYQSKKQKFPRRVSVYTKNIRRSLSELLTKEHWNGHIYKSSKIDGWCMKASQYRFLFRRTK